MIALWSWHQVIDLLVAFALSTLIGLEREIRQKAAGLRTHTLVGVGTALFMVINKYGFVVVLGFPARRSASAAHGRHRGRRACGLPERTGDPADYPRALHG